MAHCRQCGMLYYMELGHGSSTSCSRHRLGGTRAITVTQAAIFPLHALIHALVVCAALLPSCVVAAPASAATQERPRIGLALSGGGARGAAHIGVLKALEELRIPIDYIAGTSMGAVVGGLYASGLSPQQLEHDMLHVDWDRTFDDKSPRRYMPFRRREDDLNHLAKLDLGYKDGHFVLPRSLIAGQNLTATLREMAFPVATIGNFNALPVPFRAVTTDIGNGTMVVLDHGDLTSAMRASMSIPGVFAPVENDGHLLVDGGLVRALPVDVVRAMGADVVIAVDVGTPLLPQKDLNSLLNTSTQTFRIVTRGNTEQQKKLLRPGDVAIVPNLDDVGFADFSAGARAIADGEAATLRLAPLLRRYSVSEPEYQKFLARQRARATPSALRIDFIRVENHSPVADAAIRRLLRVQPGETLDADTLREDMARIYGLGDFDRVDYRVATEGGRHGLIVTARGKPWGPNYLSLGFNINADFVGDQHYDLLVNYTMTWLNSRGAELRNKLALGTDPHLDSEFYQPLDAAGRYFVAPRLEIGRSDQGAYLDGTRIATYRTTITGAGIDIGRTLGNSAELRMGWTGQQISANAATAGSGLPTFDARQRAWRIKLAYDNLDAVGFPQRGGIGGLNWYGARRWLGAEIPYDKLSAHWQQAFSTGPHTLLAVAQLGSSLDTTLPYYDEFTLGGLFHLSGLGTDQLRGHDLALFELRYRRRVGGGAGGLADHVYLGASLEAGNVWAQRKDVRLSGLRYAASVYGAANTIFGPLYLAYGRADGGHYAFYLYLGRTF